ncbi:response regulator [Butyrivibrio sp. CB08]|uniref:response regulator n=1 Tax=Butyrivibrio sp. CB08 TaxID=2364879 RepID=UPI000EA8CDDC|nr:response regulator [Butyrivibrio sp. CB08]RKM62358.1 response regulator [Butyrivibrio sp. CB08]
MTSNSVMVIGQKESFFIKVLVKKILDGRMHAFYVQNTVNAINKNIDSADIAVYYMDSGEVIDISILRFLSDTLHDKQKKLILIGDPADTKLVCETLPGDVIYEILPRPLDNEQFMSIAKEFFKRSSMDEFKKSILVCDDDPNYLGLVREWLKDTYKVSVVTSGLQAIKWLGKNKADLILLDHEMPVTTGPQVLEMLRADDETKSIPVMFLTGKSDKESVLAVVALKPEGYFLKNIEKDELLEKLNEFFTLRTARH